VAIPSPDVAVYVEVKIPAVNVAGRNAPGSLNPTYIQERAIVIIERTQKSAS
jgi:hypothetical protein